eukprot:ctg_361.g123
MDDALVLGLEEADGVGFGHPLNGAHPRLAPPSSCHPRARPLQHHIKVHAIDTGAGIVLQTQINMLLDAKAEAAGVGKVRLVQFVLLDAQPALQQVERLGAAHGDVGGDPLSAANAKLPDGQSRPRGDHRLTVRVVLGGGELLQHAARFGERIAARPDAAVDHQLVHLESPHGIFQFFGDNHGEETKGESRGGDSTGRATRRGTVSAQREGGRGGASEATAPEWTPSGDETK